MNHDRSRLAARKSAVHSPVLTGGLPRRLVCLALIVLSLAAAGCGIFKSKDPRTQPAKLEDFKPSVALKTVWQGSTGKGRGFVFTPAVEASVVYAAGADGQLSASELESGRVQWRVEAAKGLSSGVGAGSGIELVGTQKGELIAFDSAGKRIWKADLAAELLAPPVVEEETVVVRTGDGRLVAFDARDGKRKWSYQRVTPPLALRAIPAPTVARGAVFAGFPGGVVVGLRLEDGRVGWETVLSPPRGTTELERIADISGPVILDGNRVCAAAYQGRVGCLDVATGKALWSREASSSTGIAVDGRYVYVSEDSGAVSAFDKSSGASVWRQNRLANRRLGAPIVLGSHVLVADGFGYIHALSTDTGEFTGRLKADGSPIAAPPQLAGSRAVFQSANGGLYAVEVRVE